MPARRTSRLVLRNCQLMLTSTLFSEQNDSATTQVKNATDRLILQQYTTSNVCTQGSFTVSYPGTNEPDDLVETGTMWPSRDSYPLHNSSLTVTANQAGSQYYCVFPLYPSDGLVRSAVTLTTQGQEHQVPLGSVAFVFGTDYTVNGQAAADAGYEVIACETIAAQIIAGTAPCKILEFRVTPLTTP